MGAASQIPVCPLDNLSASVSLFYNVFPLSGAVHFLVLFTFWCCSLSGAVHFLVLFTFWYCSLSGAVHFLVLFAPSFSRTLFTLSFAIILFFCPSSLSHFLPLILFVVSQLPSLLNYCCWINCSIKCLC